MMSRYKNPLESLPPAQSTVIHRASCQYCQRDLPWAPAKQGTPQGDHIVGLSRTGSQICNRCYERPREPDTREEAIEQFRAAHQDDIWALLSASSHDVRSREEGAALMRQLRNVRLGR